MSLDKISTANLVNFYRDEIVEISRTKTRPPSLPPKQLHRLRELGVIKLKKFYTSPSEWELTEEGKLILGI
jgi:hypothetical protein